MIYIYGIVCPITGAIRYIGKSINPEKRLRAHILAAVRGSYNHHTARWLRSLQRVGLSPSITVLGTVGANEAWQEMERRHIAEAIASGARLTNSTSGGEGLDYIRPEDKERYLANLSAALKKLWSTPERRLEAKERSLKAWADPEIRRRRLASFKAAAARPDVKIKVAAAHASMSRSPEVKAKRARAMKNYWETSAGKQVRADLLNDQAFLQAQSDRLKQRWQDEAHREKMQAARWTDETKDLQAAAVLDPDRQAKIKQALTPEVIARRNAAIKDSWARRKALKQEAQIP